MRRQLTLEVSSAAEADELRRAWEEIVTQKKLPRLAAATKDEDEIVARAAEALAVIVGAIERGPDTGQGRHLIRFLAGIYNGEDYPFDLSSLRALDTELAHAVFDYLRYDSLGKREVHHHLPGGAESLHAWRREAGIHPVPSLTEEHLGGLLELHESSTSNPNELLREAMEDLFQKYRAGRGRWRKAP